ncbi:MAG TPA: sulfur carrier protein ThiS [Micromonosporaceae bacterium]
MSEVTISVNGRRTGVDEDTSVAAVVAGLTAASQGIAVALNGEVVPRGAWAGTRVRDGDVVEIVTAVQGG